MQNTFDAILERHPGATILDVRFTVNQQDLIDAADDLRAELLDAQIASAIRNAGKPITRPEDLPG